MEAYTQFFAAAAELAERSAMDLAIAPLTLVAPERMEQQLAQGLPLLPLVPPQLPVDRLLADLGEYRALLARYMPQLADELAQQEERLAAAAPEQRSRLVSTLALGDNGALFDLAQELGVAPERLYFLGELALRPYLGVYAERLESVVDLSGYHGSRCPVCGRQAQMGHIDADNLKHLHCHTCATTWRFGRVQCSNCGCTDATKIGYFTVEDDESLRVEHCDECGHYLKVVNLRVRSRKVDFFLEDAATLQLDRLAESEGYRKGGRPVAVQ